MDGMAAALTVISLLLTICGFFLAQVFFDHKNTIKELNNFKQTSSEETGKLKGKIEILQKEHEMSYKHLEKQIEMQFAHIGKQLTEMNQQLTNLTNHNK